jgi:diamine N-acetyltransferase
VECQTDTVILREITKDNYRAICALEVAPKQREFVASNTFSLAQAHFHPEAWYRAIYAGDAPIGFLMLSDIPDAPEYFLWRLMIAANHQRKGYGCRAVELLVEHVRTRPNATELLVSYHPGDGTPGDFYRRLGFQDTGRIEEGEIVLRLPL